MQTFFKTFRTFANQIGKLNFMVVIFLLAGICLTFSTFGQSDANPCTQNKYTFRGQAEATLCSQYGGSLCMAIGAGTSIEKASDFTSASISGSICIIGDFYVDKPFSFINCTAEISNGVTIFVTSKNNPSNISNSFTIDNSKLFACNNMWNGIQLSSKTTIFTKNNSIIEDAHWAIKADNIQYSTLFIENTTFNRDEIGILLVQNPSLTYAATIGKFNNNKFLCTSPLNGTSDQITYAGIKTDGVPFSINPVADANNNLFEGLQYGIISVGANTTIAGSYFKFNKIRRDGINLAEGSLTINNSAWTDCEEKGVNIGLAHNVYILDNSPFTITTALPETVDPNFRKGVFIDAFGLNADIVLCINFNADLAGTTTPVYGIDLKGGNVGAGTEIAVLASSFNINAKAGAGVHMKGLFPESSSTFISECNFSTAHTSNFILYGIEVESGTKNNLHIWGNDFGIFPSGHNTHGIGLEPSNGVDNTITNNEFNAYKGVFATNGGFQNVTYCSNKVKAYSFFPSTGFNFLGGITPGIDFTENEIYATGAGVDISAGSTIGPQLHKGNKWFPVEYNSNGLHVIWRAGVHARCDDPSLAGFSKFTVHTDQSVWNNNTGSYTFFSEYYPEKIDPVDPIYGFFKSDPLGTPASGCISNGFNGPGGGDGLDRIIADGQAPTIVGNPASPWILNSYLYKKLKDNPSLVGTYAAYPTFIATHASANVGRFYEVNKKMKEAFTATSTQYQQSQQVLDNIKALLVNIKNTDGQINATTNGSTLTSLTDTKSGYLEQLRTYQSDYNTISAAYTSQLMSKLQEALVLNQQIVPAAQYETNEKTVNGIYLQSLLNGTMTESQITELQGIGQQCTETGGLAVGMALGLLKDCQKAGLNICTTELITDTEPVLVTTPIREGLIGIPGTSDGEAWLYPNPATSTFYIKLPLDATGDITVTDLMGKNLIHQTAEEAGAVVEVNKYLAPGMYLVSLKTANGSLFIEKLVIQSK